jgi:tetratricopeptide (TPR) repeat protein
MLKELEEVDLRWYPMDPMSTPCTFYLGSVWYELGNSEKAHGFLEQARLVHPWHVHVLNNLGVVRGISGDTKTPISLFEEALRISPGFDEAGVNLSALYFNQKRYEEAFNTIRKVDPATKNLQYPNHFATIITTYVKEMAGQIEDQPLKEELLRIANSEKWCFDILAKADEAGQPFRSRLIDESVYLLKTEGKLSPEEADKLGQTYRQAKP